MPDVGQELSDRFGIHVLALVIVPVVWFNLNHSDRSHPRCHQRLELGFNQHVHFVEAMEKDVLGPETAVKEKFNGLDIDITLETGGLTV